MLNPEQTGIDSHDFVQISFSLDCFIFRNLLDAENDCERERELKIVRIVNKNVEFIISIRIIITTLLHTTHWHGIVSRTRFNLNGLWSVAHPRRNTTQFK